MNIIIWYGKLLITANLHTHNTFSDNLNLISCLLLPSNALVLDVFNLFLCCDTNKIVFNSKQTFYLHKFEILRDEHFWGVDLAVMTSKAKNFAKIFCFVLQCILKTSKLNYYKKLWSPWCKIKEVSKKCQPFPHHSRSPPQTLAVIFSLFFSCAWFRSGIDFSEKRNWNFFKFREFWKWNEKIFPD